MSTTLKSLVLLAAALPLAAVWAASPAPATTAKAVFAGGCFWCMESDFEKLPGVLSAVSGYTGGKEANPTYDQVSDHLTGHAEAVEVTFNPAQVSYSQLVEYYWRHIDPTVKDQQFCDHGPQYRSAIFPLDAQQMQLAQASKAALEKAHLFPHIYTEITPASTFWPAEDYHQDYYKKNTVRYHYYRFGCGRDARVEAVWGKH